MQNNSKKLTKSANNKMLAGCLAGIAEYLGWDPTLVRIVYAIFTLFSAGFPGICIYIILYLVMPKALEQY